MEKIEAALHTHFAQAAARNEQTPNSAAAFAPNASVSDDSTAPFAKVNSVVPNSPAATAGLRAGDRIVRFGAAHWLNHNRLAKVSEIVSQSIGGRFCSSSTLEGEANTFKTPIAVAVLRYHDGVAVRRAFLLTPRNDWGGRGLLGCHLVPV